MKNCVITTGFVNLLYAKIFFTTFLIVGISPASQAQSFIGGDGGTQNQSSRCSAGYRATGLQVRKRKVLDAVGIVCRKIDENGHWLAGRKLGVLKGAKGGTSTNIIECPLNNFLGALNVATALYSKGRTVAAGLSITCYLSDETLRAIPLNANTFSIGNGKWGKWSKCRNSGLVNNIDVRFEIVVDALRLGCANPISRPQP